MKKINKKQRHHFANNKKKKWKKKLRFWFVGGAMCQWFFIIKLFHSSSIYFLKSLWNQIILIDLCEITYHENFIHYIRKIWQHLHNYFTENETLQNNISDSRFSFFLFFFFKFEDSLTVMLIDLQIMLSNL